MVFFAIFVQLLSFSAHAEVAGEGGGATVGSGGSYCSEKDLRELLYHFHYLMQPETKKQTLRLMYPWCVDALMVEEASI